MVNDVQQPPFSIKLEERLTGNEAEFQACEVTAKKYLDGISAVPIIKSYTHNERWGHVLRLVYSSKLEPSMVASGTFMCWLEPNASQVTFSIDPNGGISDLE